jgi:hypothetical protein
VTLRIRRYSPACAAKGTEPKYNVGDRATDSLSAGRVVDGVVKAIINRADGVRLQVDYGKDEPRSCICGRCHRLRRDARHNSS